MAHRGGNWSADNSISNFKAAVENRVEGVETDVWISKDGVPMIVHGGDDGQLGLYGLPDQYVYDWTCQELQTKLRLPNGEIMPTLQEMLSVFLGTQILLNIELKGPLSADRKALYNFQLAARTVYNMILELQIQKYVMISSFVPETITEMKKCLNEKREFMLCQLLNRKNLAEVGGLQGYNPKEGVDGINISATYLTQEIVNQAKKQGKTVGVWLERKDTKETKELYDLVYQSGVDFVFLDAPLPGM